MNTQDNQKEYREALKRRIKSDASQRKYEEEIIACYGNPVGRERSKVVAFIAAALIPAIVSLAFTAVPFWIFMPILDWWMPIFALSIWTYLFFLFDGVHRRVYGRTRNGYSWWIVTWKGFFGGWLSGGTGGTTIIWWS